MKVFTWLKISIKVILLFGALVKVACVKVENVFSIIGVGLSTALSKKPKEFRLLNVSVRYMEHVCKGGVRFVLRAIPYAAARFHGHCPACRTYLIATRFWVVVICPTIKCLTVLEFSFILFDLCLFITIFNFILNYVPIVTFWIFTYHKIWILWIIFCFIWNYWIIYFLTCLEVFWSVVS